MEQFTCEGVCNKKKHCGRHRCNTRCCNKSEHKCDLICGKKLRCGKHTCTEVCHGGHCDKCWEYSYDELRCDCGAEVIYPPIPCGTPPPPCNRVCSRVHPCNHPLYHTCHTEGACPPCTVRTTKLCRGGHKECSVPCFLDDVSCGCACGQSLPCGHNCIKIYHKGVCLPNGEVCTRPCPTPRKLCGHPCASPCHMGKPCPPDALCRQQITIKCDCGRRTEETLCLCPNRDDLFTFAINSSDLATLVGQLAGGHHVDLQQLNELKSEKLSDRKLECDEICRMEERNRKLKEALDIKEAVVSPLVDKPNYTDFLCQLARSVGRDAGFIQQVEETIRQLVKVALKKATPQHHAFPPTTRHRRQAIHELAEAYGCDSQSFDEEPKRSVTVYTTRRSYLQSVPLMKYIHQKPPSYQPRPANIESINTSRQKEPSVENKVDYFEGDY